MANKMKSGGIQDGLLGIDYQFKLLGLFAHRSVHSGIKFKLSTELTDVGKFDDVAFEVLDSNGNPILIQLGQAKHKRNPVYFTYEIIMESKEFKLSFYFDSLLEILSHKKYDVNESVLIITNNKIDDSVKETNGLVKMDSNNGQSSLYFLEDTSDDEIFNNIGKRFKFPDEAHFSAENQAIFEIFKINFVAKKLASLLLSNKSKIVRDFCHQNRKYLFANIFDESTMEFRQEILDGTNSRFDVFRSTFEQSFKDLASKGNQSNLKTWFNNCWDYFKKQSIKTELQLIGSSSDAMADSDQDDFDKNLKLFMAKLVYVTDLKIEDIDEKIKVDLRRKYNSKDVSVPYGMIEKRITDLITKRGDSIHPITKEEFGEVFEIFELFEDKIIVVRETRRSFEESLLEFKTTHQKLESFLDLIVDQPSNILHIKTLALETSFTSMQIYSKLSSAAHKDTYIILKSSSAKADFKRGVRVFQLDDLCEFLIIELDSDNNLFEDHKDCLENILQKSSKRMIVISGVNSKIILNNSQELKLPHIYPKDLKTQDQVLNQPVNFPNYATTWMNLVSKDFLLNNVLLSDLLNTKSIAGNVQVSKNYDKDLYIPRTFECRNILKPEIMQECRHEEFVYNKQAFESKFKLNPGKNVHWIDKSDQDLKWIDSSNSNYIIHKYIQEKSSKCKEDIFAHQPARVSILVDIAGMGKSTALNYLAQKLKQNMIPTNGS